jgi:hypothetical protein
MIQFIKGLQSQKYTSLALTSIDIIFMLSFLLILLICCSLFHKAFAASPAFDQIFIPDQVTSNQINDWVQTYGNDSTHLRSDHANILAVDYLSDGKTLDATFWLALNLENDSIYSQPLKRIRYGMLIALFPCLQLQDITEPITTFILKQLMEDGVNIFTNYRQQVLLHL